MKLFGLDISKVQNQALPDGPRKKSADQYHEEKQKYRISQDLRNHRMAVELANNIETYNRYDLHQIYRETLMDPSLPAQWNTRVLKTLDKEFHLVGIEDKVDRSAAEVFKAPWFNDWVRLVLEQHLWGFTLIEFGPWNSDMGSFVPYMDSSGRYHSAVESVDRDYVKPEWGIIVNNYQDGRAGKHVSYLSSSFGKRLMFTGSPHKENSILYIAAQYMLMKDNAHKNWSEWAEVFATSLRVGKTEGGDAQRKNLFQTLRDMGNNGVAVIDTEDSFEYVNVNRQDAYEVYQAFLEYCDNEVAKLIFGQNVVTNNTGRVVGKVGEDLSNMYGDADAKLVEWIINKELIPYMNKQGADLDGYRFKYDTTEKVRLTDRANIDKNFSDMGWKLNQEYIERTYGVITDEYIGIPFSGREDMKEDDKKVKE